MSDSSITIGGKQVKALAASPPDAHAPYPQTTAAWEEGWERKTYRTSIPIGLVLLLVLLVVILVRLLRKS